MSKRGRFLAIIAGLLTAGAILAVYLFVPASAPLEEDSGRNRWFSGYFTPDDRLVIANFTIAEGTYRLGYAMDVRFISTDPGATLTCGFIDPNGIIGYFASMTAREIAADGRVVRIAESTTFDLPEITVGLRCSPSSSGAITAELREIAITIAPE